MDSKALLEFGFANFKNIPIPENETAYTSGQESIAVGLSLIHISGDRGRRSARRTAWSAS